MATLIDARLIVPGNNDRTEFNETALIELAESIKQNGLLQPPTVRPIEGTEMYQIIDRRATLPGYTAAPVARSAVPYRRQKRRRGQRRHADRERPAQRPEPD